MSEKHIYTEEELDEVRDWIVEREQFKQSGTTGRGSNGVAILGSAMFTGAISLIFLYGPIWVLFTYINNSIPDGLFHYLSLDYVLSNSEGQMGFNPMAFLFSSIIVVLAVIGGASIIGWLCMIGASSNDDKWYEKEIKKSERMCDATLQQAEQEHQSEMDRVVGELEDQRKKYTALSIKAKKLEEQIKDNNYAHKRERKLWALEKKELQYQLKLKQGLVDEMDNSESPLGGLYNE